MGCREDGRHPVNQHAVSHVHICSRSDTIERRFTSPLSTRLGSSLSPNGLHISAAKRGGYDLYSLDSGIVLHTFVHGLPLDGDVYPGIFLPRGFAFCGATVDGTVTLWDVGRGDRLQSVQHLRASMTHSFPWIGAHLRQAGATLHAVAVCLVLLAYAPACPLSRTHPILAGSHGRQEWCHAPCNGMS